jgi:uncharacterized membrane protein HdeD (DUF308 family)
MEEQDAQQLGEVRKSAGWMTVLGILMVLAGVFAVMTPLLMAAWIVMLIGVVLCVGGFAEILHAFRARDARLWHFLFGLLGLIAGLIMLFRPGSGFTFFTLVLTWFFLLEGVGNIGLSMRMKPQRGWGWMLFAGLVSLLLGVLIFAGWPLSGGLLIGIYTGIFFMFKGWALVALGSAMRQAAKNAA